MIIFQTREKEWHLYAQVRIQSASVWLLLLQRGPQDLSIAMVGSKVRQFSLQISKHPTLQEISLKALSQFFCYGSSSTMLQYVEGRHLPSQMLQIAGHRTLKHNLLLHFLIGGEMNNVGLIIVRSKLISPYKIAGVQTPSSIVCDGTRSLSHDMQGSHVGSVHHACTEKNHGEDLRLPWVPFPR